MEAENVSHLQSKEGLKALLSCSHGNTRVVEGKTFCPDCGVGVVFRWVVLRCSGCHQRRPGRYWMRQVVPQERCCTYCGDANYETQVLENPSFYQIRHAMLSVEAEDDAKKPTWQNNVWVQTVQYLLLTLTNRIFQTPVT